MKRQIIVDTIAEQMKLISAANGFYSEAGKNVFEWLEKPLDKDEYPAIIIRDVSDDTNDSQILEHSLKVEVDIAISNKTTSLWDMREVTSDVLKAFGVIEDTINYQCQYLGSEFLVEQKDTIYGGVRLSFTVAYQTGRWEQ
jgi:hypothetical protein